MKPLPDFALYGIRSAALFVVVWILVRGYCNPLKTHRMITHAA